MREGFRAGALATVVAWGSACASEGSSPSVDAASLGSGVETSGGGSGPDETSASPETGSSDPGTTSSASEPTSASATETTTASDPTGAQCKDDTCPFTAGVTYQCQARFVFGLNYAWHFFGGDFGGIPQWGQAGVSGNRQAIRTDLERMRDAAGANVIRWWIFPDFRGAGITFDGADTPTGIGGTLLADLEAALELAAETDVYLMLTLWSFDGFRPTADNAGITVRSIQPLVVDASRRAALLETVVRPLAAAVASSPNADRMIAWDVINEPEWAISGSNPYGDEAYTPNAELTTVTHAQMETFLAETIAVLRQESDAQISIGAAAFKWARAWQTLDTDFHQFHMYDWVDDYWPHDGAPPDYGLGDKPVVMGEFPLSGLTRTPLPQMLDNWWNQGYAGALGWAFTDSSFNTDTGLAQMQSFASTHACETKY